MAIQVIVFASYLRCPFVHALNTHAYTHVIIRHILCGNMLITKDLTLISSMNVVPLAVFVYKYSKCVLVYIPVFIYCNVQLKFH